MGVWRVRRLLLTLQDRPDLDGVGELGRVVRMEFEILARQWTAARIMGGVFDWVAEVWHVGVGVLIVLGVIIKVVGWFR